MTENIPADLAENLIGFCESRAAVYALLSRCYEAEVDAALAEEIAERCSFETDEPALAEAFSALRASLAARDEVALEQLAVAFNRVFFGMGPRTAQKAFPYESVYTSEGGLMMQDAYSQVLALYRAAEFAKNPTIWPWSWRSCNAWPSVPPAPCAREMRKRLSSRCATSWRLCASTC